MQTWFRRFLFVSAVLASTSGTAFAQEVCAVPAGMVAWWPLDGDAADWNGLHDGTVVGSPLFLPGMVGQALSLEDASRYVAIPDSHELNPTAGLTLEAWIKPLGGSYPPILKKNGPGDGAGYALELTSDFRGVHLRIWGVGAITANGITIGEWNHVAGTYDGHMLQLFVNGTLAASNSFSGAPDVSSGELHIGHDPILGRYFEGLIDEPALFSRALSSLEIRAIYDAGSDGKCRVGDPSAPPFVFVPEDITAASLSASGRMVFFDVAAWDAVDGPLAPTCSAISGSTFAVGITMVSCAVTNSRGASATETFGVTVVQAADPMEGLIARWSFDEAAGTTATDSSGNGRNGSITEPTYITSDGASLPDNVSALRFTGTTSVTIPDSPAFAFGPTDPFTISFWARLDATVDEAWRGILWKSACSGALNNYTVYTGAGNVILIYRTNTVNVGPGVKYRLEPGRLTQVAITHDGSGALRFYFDGLLAGTVSGFHDATTAPGVPIQIGSIPGCTSAPPFIGMLDDVRIYNRPLTDLDVAGLNLSRHLEVVHVVASYGGAATFKAVLSSSNALVRGRSLTFRLDGVTVGTAVTDQNGVAALTDIDITAFDLGRHEGVIEVTFDGDEQVPPATVRGTLTVVPGAPPISWVPPDDGGGDLSSAQNATSPVAGTFEYRFRDGSTLGLFEMCATFTPEDLVHYLVTTVCIDIAYRVTSAVSAPRQVAFVETALTPWRFAADAGRQLLYVIYAEQSFEVVVLDLQSRAVIRTIPLHLDGLTGAGSGLSVDPASGRLYVADNSQPIIWVVEADQPQPTATISLASADPAAPLSFGNGTHMALSPVDDRLYVSARREGTVPTSVLLSIDTTDLGRAPETFPLGVDCPGSPPDTLAVNVTEQTVYIATGSCLIVEVVDMNPARPSSYGTVTGRLPIPAKLGEPDILWDHGAGTALAVNRRTGRAYLAGVDWVGFTVWLQEYDADPSSPTFNEPLRMTHIPGTGRDYVPGVSGLLVNEDSQLLYLVSNDPQANTDEAFLVAVDATTGSIASTTTLSHSLPYAPMTFVRESNSLYVGVLGRLGSGIAVFEETRVTESVPTPSSTEPVTVDARAVQLTFAAVVSPGETTIAAVDASSLPEMVPAQYTVAGYAFEISTTATFSGPITLCFNVASVTDPAEFASLRVLHGEDGALVDRTSSHDFATGTICATVDSLSPFVIARKIPPAFTVLALHDQTRPVKSGSTVPVKVRLLDANGANASAESILLTALGLSLVGANGDTDVADAGNANPDGGFRYDPQLGGYIFNLSTRGLAPGIYRLNLRAGDDPRSHAVEFRIGR